MPHRNPAIPPHLQRHIPKVHRAMMARAQNQELVEVTAFCIRPRLRVMDVQPKSIPAFRHLAPPPGPVQHLPA